jgi:hypothetical protein
MKLSNSQRSLAGRRGREQGMAVIVVMALIALILIYVMGNLRTFNSLGHELKLLEQQQTRRLKALPVQPPVAVLIPRTNAVPAK